MRSRNLVSCSVVRMQLQAPPTDSGRDPLLLSFSIVMVEDRK